MLKSLLARFPIRKTVGLYLGNDEVGACLVAATPLGPVEMARRVEPAPAADEPVGATAARLLEAVAGGVKVGSLRVVAGLPALKVFFTTRPFLPENRDATPAALLQEALQSPSLHVDEMVVDLIKAQVARRPVASLAACRKKYLTNLISALEAESIRPIRAEPAPCALLRLAARRRPPRGTGLVVRVLLGAPGCLALLTAGDVPLVWRSFDLRAGREAESIRAAISAVRMLGRYAGLDSAGDVVMVHGRPDLGPLAEVAGVAEQDDEPASGRPRLVRLDDPGTDAGAVAMGLALGDGPNVEAFNLIRWHRHRASIREIFPWAEALVQASVLGLASLLLMHRLDAQEATRRAARAEDAKFAWAAKLDDAKLETEKKDLEQRLDAVSKFTATRVLWSPYARDLAGRMPAGFRVASLVGTADLPSIGGKAPPSGKPPKALTLRMTAPIAGGGAMPAEIGRFLGAIRGESVLGRDFAKIDMVDLKSGLNASGPPEASFTVACLPGGDTPAAKPKTAGPALATKAGRPPAAAKPPAAPPKPVPPKSKAKPA